MDERSRSESVIHGAALEALRSRALIRLPFDGGAAALVRTEAADAESRDPHRAELAHLVDEYWALNGAGHYDGALMSVGNFRKSGAAVSLGSGTIRYRDYLATDRILLEFPDRAPSLAVGAHAVLLCGDDLVLLRLQDSRLALPGGAVDAADLHEAGGDALRHAISREVLEETGLDLADADWDITGLYVGGVPTHLIVLLATEIPSASRAALEAFSPADRHDRIRAVELLPLAGLVEKMDGLPLVVRAALRSLMHARGKRPAWFIEM